MIPLRYNLRSLAVRKTSTGATVLGIALVVFVLAAALMLSAGVQKTMANSGQPDVAIVLRRGSDNEMGSVVDDPQVSVIRSMPGIKQLGNSPLTLAEVVVVAAMEKIGASGVTNVTIRGVPSDVTRFRSGVHLVDGRAALPGSDEAIIGKRVRGRFRGTELGQSFEIRKNRPITIVGVFEDGGSSHESEIWVDFDVVRSSFRREGVVSTIRVKLESPEAFPLFRDAVEKDQRAGLQAVRESTFFEKQSEGTSKFIGVLGTIVAFFFSLGAMIGAMITMYGAVANRKREIGVLRALGFSRISILGCFLLESMLIALIGGGLGALASMAMASVKFSMMNMATWSEIVFSFDPTPQVILTALGFAGGMGLVGGFLPAVRAARISAVTAMRGG